MYDTYHHYGVSDILRNQNIMCRSHLGLKENIKFMCRTSWSYISVLEYDASGLGNPSIEELVRSEYDVTDNDDEDDENVNMDSKDGNDDGGEGEPGLESDDE